MSIGKMSREQFRALSMNAAVTDTDPLLEEMQETQRIQEAQNIQHTLLERGNRYGKFSGHSRITQNIKESMHLAPNWDRLTDSQKEALEMTAHKIGRILNGDPNYVDSWWDVIGYVQLVVDELRENQ